MTNNESNLDSTQRHPPSFWSELKRRKVIRVAITYAVVAWIIIQIASVTFAGFGIPVWAFRFVTLMMLLGFPVALVLAWAFELTPEGVKLTKNVSEEEKNIASQAKRNWTSIAFAATLPTIIFGTLALYFYLNSSAHTSLGPDRSIAVLPFDNRSNIEEDQFFTDGIHDDLLTQISRIQNIRTISRTSVMSYKDTDKIMPQIGKELGVATLLEGGVQRAGKQIRINMQLIDAKTDSQIWANSYTREMTAENIFIIQTEIAQAIANALKTVLSPNEKEQIDKLPTYNLQALEANFHAGSLMAKASSQDYLDAIPLLQKALELDPNYADAHALLANAYISRIYYGGAPVERQIGLARPHIERALEIDAFNEDALVQSGMMKRYLHQLDEAKAAFLKVIEINPNYTAAHQGLGILMQWSYLDAKAAIPHFRQAVELDPLSLHAKSQLADALKGTGESDEALAIMQELVRKEPDSALFQLNLGKVQAHGFKRYDLAIKAMRLAYALDPKNSQVMLDISRFYEDLNAPATAVWWFERLLAAMPNQEYANEIQSYVHLLNGENEKAIEGIRSVDTNSVWYPYLQYHLVLMDPNETDRNSALQRLLAMLPDLRKPEPNTLEFPEWSVLCADLLYERGEKERAQRIVKAALNVLNKDRMFVINYYHYITLSQLILEDRKAALEAFSTYIENGGLWSATVRYAQGAIDRKMNGDPEYDRLAAIGAARARKQLERIAAWEEAGELAPIPDINL